MAACFLQWPKVSPKKQADRPKPFGREIPVPKLRWIAQTRGFGALENKNLISLTL
jgi:hypothetical protein